MKCIIIQNYTAQVFPVSKINVMVTFCLVICSSAFTVYIMDLHFSRAAACRQIV